MDERSVGRREVVAGAGGLAALGLGGAYLLYSSSAERVEAVEVDGFEAPGSSGGKVEVPDTGRPSFVEFFATWCSTCKKMMPEIAEAYDRLDDVQFVSITYEPVGRTVSREEVVDWWREHGGIWQVAHDSDFEATRAFDASGVPSSYVVTSDGTVGWSGSGYHGADEIVEFVEEHGGR